MPFKMNKRKNSMVWLRAAALLLMPALLMTNCKKNSVVENQDHVSPEQLMQGFVTPPDTVKPWVYWYWISDNISKEGITKDIEAMARIGVGEALIGNIGLPEMSYGKTHILSEEWWQLIEHAIREGKRVGVNIGMFNCPGWSQSGGPWVKSTEAMRYLTSSETVVEGGKEIVMKLVQPKSLFQDVRLIAYPAPEADQLTIASVNPKISTIPVLRNSKLMFDGDTASVCLFSGAGNGKTITIDFEATADFTARSLMLYPAKSPFAADVDLLVNENGTYKSIKTFRFDRSNPALNVGDIPWGPVSVAFDETSAKKYRLVFSNFNLTNFLSSTGAAGLNVGIAEISLSSAPRLESYIEKQLGKMCQTPFPLWKEYQWKSQTETGSADMKIDPKKVIDISKNLSADGTLTWEAPAGKWIIMRIGVTPTGTKNSPSAPYATGWEVDKMSRGYLRNHFDAFIGVLLKRMPAEDRTALKHVVLDSYEMGSQNWTDGFAEDFTKSYGYDPMPWMPVLSGRIVASAEQSNRFLWDMRRLIANRVAYDYVGGLRDLSQEKGLRVWLENYGHWGFPSEFLMYGGQSHDIAGEFWNEGELGNIECRASSSAAHIYGKRRVSAESYTSAGLAYQRYPGMLKKRGDWSYTEGINHVVLHLYVQQPYEEKTPGINAPFGTEFNRKNTWFDQAKKWVDYQRRCMFMLQRGLAVNDVCYFIGEDAPKMTGTRIPELPKGYSFDYINAEVIMNRITVKDGTMVLPDGMSYKLMVLPPLETMRPELLKKIRQLVADGARVLGPVPDQSPSLQNYPAADAEVKSLAAELWGKVDGTSVKYATVGKGMIMNGLGMKEALDQVGVLPDVSVPENTPLLWMHRRLPDAEIYFITNQSENTLRIEPGFRVKGRQPELWDATSGSMRDLKAFVQEGEITRVPLILDPYGSAFIMFRKSGKPESGKMEVNFPAPKILLDITTPWEVSFDASRRGPEKPVVMSTLEDWSKSSDISIKYYAGTALYKNKALLGEIPAGETIYLELGKVDIMAEVKVNGQSAGGVWTAPWHVDITRLIKAGDNTIEVEVVNNWVNRLIGDSRLPEKDRKTWINVNAYKPADPLQPSGLQGPVSIVSVKY
jgi:hypothetical protein